MSVSIEVLVLRHGERIDEVPDSSIVNDRPKWDPPLTRNGYKQAAEAGVRLQGEHQRRPFERIYVSPCTRTFQTASFVAAQLGGVPLRPVPGLAECAAAVQKYGISAFDPKGKGPRFLASEQAGAYCAPGTTIEPTDALYSEGFEACVGRLASEAAAQGLTRVLLVSHREGIRDLCNLAGFRGRASTAYCCIAQFRYTPDSDQYELLTAPTTKVLPTRDPLPAPPPPVPNGNGVAVTLPQTGSEVTGPPRTVCAESCTGESLTV